MTAAREVNEHMPVHMVELVVKGLSEAGVDLSSAKVAVMGLAFLRDSDDVRNSPSLTIIDRLSERVKELIVHDPMVEKGYKVPLVREMMSALSNADCMAIVTDHSCYTDLDFDWIKRVMHTPIIIDGRNVLNAEAVRARGITYLGIGKGK
jgi:UDP-N-acetyl-D-mannosaminuronic acid dehydrogenase